MPLSLHVNKPHDIVTLYGRAIHTLGDAVTFLDRPETIRISASDGTRHDKQP